MGRNKHPEPLTPAEQRVLQELKTGATNAEIAVRLGLSINTVKYHIANMFGKTGLEDRAELARWEMPRDRGRFGGWGVRAAVAAGLVGVTVVVLAVIGLFTEDSGDGREAWFAYPSQSTIADDSVTLDELVSGRRKVISVGDGWIAVLARWSPDGTVLAIGVVPVQGDGPELRLYERDTFKQRATLVGVIEPFWAPDSSRVAGTTEDKLVIADSHGGVIVSEAITSMSPPRGTPQWSPNSEQFVVMDPTSIGIWDRDGSVEQLEAADLAWPFEPSQVTALFFNERSELVLMAYPQATGTGSAGAATFGTLDLRSHVLSILDRSPFEETDKGEQNAIASARPGDVVRPPGISADKRARSADVEVVVVTGLGEHTLITSGFTGTLRPTTSLVLVGDWPPAPSLAIPSVGLSAESAGEPP